MKDHRTARYEMCEGPEGLCFRFYCDLSGALLCETRPIRAASPKEALMLAWRKEGRQHFNRCAKCGCWVSDVMYNADELSCVRCVPWEERPAFCTVCGAPLERDALRCPHCGAGRREGPDDTA